MRSAFIVRAIAIAAAVAAAARADSGPPYSVAPEDLAAALSCPAAFTSEREPVLLVHGTATTAEGHWGWNYAKVLPALGFDVCLVHVPNREMSDTAISRYTETGCSPC